MNDKFKDISFELTEDGNLKISRSDIEINEELKTFLLHIVDDSLKDKIIKFFEEYKETKILLGDESLCG